MMVKISVVMPVYNAGPFLPEAIESILNQTFSDFEFIIINDGSTDDSGALISQYGLRDGRIKVKHQTNQGVVAALNTGFDLSRGKYIARMDADDVSLPERLEKQVVFMEAHPQIGVCGAWVRTIGQPDGRIWRYPVDDPTIRCQLLFHSPLAHPAVIIRQELLEETGLRYESRYKHAEDYAFWSKLSIYTKFANIPDVLHLYRMHSQQVMQTYLSTNLVSARLSQLIQLEKLGLRPNPAELELHQAIGLMRVQADKESITQAGIWLEKLRAANQQKSLYPEPQFSQVLGAQWFMTCRFAISLGWWAWRVFWGAPLSQEANLRLRTKIKFGVLCAINSSR